MNNNDNWGKTWNIHLLDQIYKNIVHNGIPVRIYDTRLEIIDHSIELRKQIFVSELAVFFKYMKTIDLNVVFIEFEPNSNVLLNSKDFNCFNMSRDDIVLTENWQKLRKLQSNDLFYLFNNFNFKSILLSSFVKNNKYYYNLILVLDQFFDLNQLNLFNSEIVKFKNLSLDDITHNFFFNFINFDGLELYSFKKIDSQEWKKINKKILTEELAKKSIEHTNLENYKNFQLKNFNKDYHTLQKEDDYLYWFYTNLYFDKLYKEKYYNYNVYLKNYFSQFGLCWFTVNSNWKDTYIGMQLTQYTYPVDELFYTSENIYLSKNNNKYLNFDDLLLLGEFDDFNFCCMSDLLFVNFNSLMDSSYDIVEGEISLNAVNYKTESKTFYDLNIKK